MIVMHDFGRNLPLDERAADDLSDRRMILGNRSASRTAFAAGEAADRERALRDCVNFVVRTKQRCLQEHAALQCRRVTHGGDRDVEARAVLGEGLDICRDHDGGDVLRRERGCRYGDTEALQHVRHALHGVRGILVAHTREADDEAVADELVLTRAGDHDEILDARANGERRTFSRQTAERQERGNE